MLKKIKSFVVEEEGQALTEYGLIIGLIAVLCIALVTTLGTKIQGYFQKIVDALK